MLKTITLLDVTITNETENTISEYIFQRLRASTKKFFVITPNPEILVYASQHPKYKRLLNEASVSLPDGIGVFLAAGLMGKRLKARIPGVDFMEELCRRSQGKPVSIGFLGGGPGVARRTAECLLKRYPGLKVRWVGEEWVNVRDDTIMMHSDMDKRDLMPYISTNDPIDILFVAFGFPKQEEWIVKNLESLPVKMAMGVGGSFDYISGEVMRAPYLIRAMGFEWLFRLVKQPWRIKRQLALITFIWYMVKALSKRRLK